MERPLYDATLEKEEEYYGQGFRIEAGVKYSRFFPGLIGKFTGGINLRLGAYFQKAETEITGSTSELDKSIRSKETGLAGSLMFSFSNTNPFTDRGAR